MSPPQKKPRKCQCKILGVKYAFIKLQGIRKLFKTQIQFDDISWSSKLRRKTDDFPTYCQRLNGILCPFHKGLITTKTLLQPGPGTTNTLASSLSSLPILLCSFVTNDAMASDAYYSDFYHYQRITYWQYYFCLDIDLRGLLCLHFSRISLLL